ncbi:hypothetical protein LSH36_316g02025 [Paralvinella palmiformis]|uniref:YEATS domain-containing protein n=1 Tax=Paralvinella palmiformis TaxID=53620 RepID=A0AAD9JH35_9ANNE|nr:hypothetical protein LSH36_316g02025 [Paralvinella palmiformis]
MCFVSLQSVQVKLELGHKASLRKKLTSEGFTHDWVVFVRGPEGSNIQHFVEKVVFHLHESFPKPKRVVKEPPYSVAESGYGSFNLPIEIYFKTKEEPRKIKFDYDLFLHLNGSPPVNHLRCEKLTFQNPTEDFRRKLIKAGGVGILGPNEFPGVPPSTQATTTPGTPQTSESKAFVELFGSSTHSESTEVKSSEVKGNDQLHVKKKKSSHSKDREKDREKHRSKSSNATSSSVTNSPVMLSSPQSTPKTTSSPLTNSEKLGKHKHSSRREGSSEHSTHKKKKKDKGHVKSKDHDHMKYKDKHRDRIKDKEGDRGNDEHGKDKHNVIVIQDKEKRRDKGGKTITCAKIETTPKKDVEEKSKEKERSKHKESTAATPSSSSSSSISRGKGHKKSHRSKEREKSKESSSEKDGSFESPALKHQKATSSPAPPNKSQLPPMSDIFSTSDYDPFEDDAATENASQPQPGTAEPDRSQMFLKSLFDEMEDDEDDDDEVDMEISENEDVDVEHSEAVPDFGESEQSPSKSDVHQSPPHIEPIVSNGLSPHEVGGAIQRPHLSPESKQAETVTITKAPSSVPHRPTERSSTQKEHFLSRWKEPESENSKKNQTPSPRDSSVVNEVTKKQDDDHVWESSPVWSTNQNSVLSNKANQMSPPRLSMDPPDLLKSTQHGDLLQFEAAQQRLPYLKRESCIDRVSPPNNNSLVCKEPNCTDLPEPVIKPGFAPNGETFELLLSLQEKLNMTKDEETLSDVVRILEESGEVFAITDASLDFDLCYLNSETVHKLKRCLRLS